MPTLLQHIMIGSTSIITSYNHPFDVTEFESTFTDTSHLLHFESPKEAYSIISEEITNWQTKLDRIKILRDKYYAHMDKREAENYLKLFADNEITMDEIDHLLNLNFTICNCLNSLLRNTTVLHSVLKVGSLDSLVNYALKGKETETKPLKCIDLENEANHEAITIKSQGAMGNVQQIVE